MFLEMPAERLADKIHGGLVGQLLGNLNGLEHEFKYIDQPGSVEKYVPALPEGAHTDDDTDLEWVYTFAIEVHEEPLLPPEVIVKAWKAHINRSIWCANAYARELMNLGIEPPLTGKAPLNPWSEFNISGQFVCETFGLMAPAMPQAAARVGVHYTHVTIDGEPAQATQLFTAMIATAFQTEDLDAILDAGLASIDPECRVRQVVEDVRAWHREHPEDWKATRAKIKVKYTRHGGGTRDRNGYELNTAATIAALLYGRGDFAETLRIAFNYGWDADNNAATSGTIIGVIRGYRWFEKQGWEIRDVYRNTTRDGMPEDETISRFAARIAAAAERLILDYDGEKVTRGETVVYRIRRQEPVNLERLATLKDQFDGLRTTRIGLINEDLKEGSSKAAKARAAYLAICLDLAPLMEKRHGAAWQSALAALGEQEALLQLLSKAPGPLAEVARGKFRRAGLVERAKTAPRALSH